MFIVFQFIIYQHVYNIYVQYGDIFHSRLLIYIYQKYKGLRMIWEESIVSSPGFGCIDCRAESECVFNIYYFIVSGLDAGVGSTPNDIVGQRMLLHHKEISSAQFFLIVSSILLHPLQIRAEIRSIKLSINSFVPHCYNKIFVFTENFTKTGRFQFVLKPVNK